MFCFINFLNLNKSVIKSIIIYIYNLLNIKKESNFLLNNYLNSLNLVYILYIFIYFIIKTVKPGQ